MNADEREKVGDKRLNLVRRNSVPMCFGSKKCLFSLFSLSLRFFRSLTVLDNTLLHISHSEYLKMCQAGATKISAYCTHAVFPKQSWKKFAKVCVREERRARREQTEKRERKRESF